MPAARSISCATPTIYITAFQYLSDAKAFRHALAQRMRKFALELNTEKTRLIEFGRFAMENRAKRGEGKPETFAFLGFTHICARRRTDGRYTVLRKTLAKRLRTKVLAVTRELKRGRHAPVPQQGRWIRSVVRGYFNYHAVPGNFRALSRFRQLVACAWLRALRRRSQKGRRLTWALWPGLALTITVYSLNMLGDALRDLLDPRLRGGGGRLGADAARSV